jgi:hypothetical protein
VLGTPKLQLEQDCRAPTTAYGGTALIVGLLRKTGAAEVIDRSVTVFARHNPYHESDHIIAQTTSLMLGGECLEDLALLQHDRAMLQMLGASRTPDPTTAGDFLRRFDETINPGALGGLRFAVDTIQDRVWKLARVRRPNVRRRLGNWGIVDLDSHISPTYAHQKQGADFSHDGRWSYHPLIVSLANTTEILDTVQRAGNAHSASGAAESLDRVLPTVFGRYHFPNVLVRGDSAFDQAAVRSACDRHGASYAMVAREIGDKPRHAMAVADPDWQPYTPRSTRTRLARRESGSACRLRGRDEHGIKVSERRYRTKRKLRIEVAEVPYTATGSETPCRLVIQRERLEDRQFDGQYFLFTEEYQFRYIVTNLPHVYTAGEVVDLVNERCDQENVIEQFKNGLPGWRNPVSEFAGNAAYLQIARLAWNLGKAIALIGLPAEAIRWGWKRLRRTIFVVAATVIRRSRQTWVRISSSTLYADIFNTAHRRLCT